MNVKSPLIAAASVHDRRNLPVWSALALSAGAVNGTALLACQRFVSHITGTLTHVGSDYARVALLLEYSAVILAFVFGAMASFWLIDGRRLRGKSPLVAAPLAVVALVLATVGVAGKLGAFGPFGRTVETAGDFVMLALLAFAMGLQNATVATTSGMIIRTSHMTGPLTDLSIALGAYVSRSTPSDVRETARKSIALRGIKIASFVAGALIAAVFAPRLQYATFFIPALIVGASAYGLSAMISLERFHMQQEPQHA